MGLLTKRKMRAAPEKHIFKRRSPESKKLKFCFNRELRHGAYRGKEKEGTRKTTEQRRLPHENHLD